MEPSGNNNGGFHGYQRIPQPTSNVTAPEVTMGLPPPAPQNNHHAGNGTNTDDTECIVREHDRRFMPLANVIRIMRTILPKHAKISDDAKSTVQESVSEFIRLITREANDRCQSEHRKTVTAEDLLWGMRKLGFDDYIEPLSLYLHRYREFDGGERGLSRGELMVQRMVDPSCLGFSRISPTVFHQTAAQDAFVGVAPPPMNGLLKDAENGEASSSQAAFICDEPFPLGDKEKL